MLRTLLLVAFVLFSLDSTSQTFSSVVNDFVPDDGSILNLSVDADGLADALNANSGLVQVCLNMDHTYTSDMEVRLIAPDGTALLLFSGIGGDGDNFTNCCLRFDASEFVSTQPAPFTGTYLPMGNMAQINNNQNPNGTWYLSVHDTYPEADQGFLYDWSISFEPNAPVYEFPFESTYLPIVFISTGGIEIPDEPKIEAHLRIIYHGTNILNFITDTDSHYEGDVLIELQGFTGPYYPKKNYDFDLIDSLNLEIDASLLGMPAENDYNLKAEYLDPTLMYNNIAYSFGRKMDRYAPRLQYCEVILNGDYIGVYSLTEKIKRSAERVDIAKLTPEDISGNELTGGYIIEMNINGDPGAWNSQYLPINYATNNLPVEFKFVYPRASEIMPEQAEYIQAFVDSFEYLIHSSNYDDPMEGYRSKIGVGSFIDFMFVNEMSTNYDSYGRSTFLYKEKITDGNKLHIGPPWDYDRGFATIEGWVWELTHPGWPFPDWWSIFDSDSTYVNQAWCRWQELRSDVWSDQAFYGSHRFIGNVSFRSGSSQLPALARTWGKQLASTGRRSSKQIACTSGMDGRKYFRQWPVHSQFDKQLK
ncbi:MAG: CotH kinase family protein [Flavobacteriales bacterium]